MGPCQIVNHASWPEKPPPQKGNDLNSEVKATIACALTIIFVNVFAAVALQESNTETGSAPLMAQLRDKDPGKRTAAVKKLGQARARDAVPALSELLVHDPDPVVRATSAYALGVIKDPRAAEPLLTSLRDDRPEVCINSVFALVQIKMEDQKRLEAFRGALANPDLRVCRAAALGLVMLGDDRTVGPLIRSLNDKRESVRSGAAFALGYLGDRRAVLPLLNSLHDKRAAVRKIVIASLGLLGDPRAVPGLKRVAEHDADPGIRSRAAEVLKSLAAGSSR